LIAKRAGRASASWKPKRGGAEQRELMERDEFYFASTQFCFTATKSANTNVSKPA
jgi:hypothetical protein